MRLLNENRNASLILLLLVIAIAGVIAISISSSSSRGQQPVAPSLRTEPLKTVEEAADYVGFKIREPADLPDEWRFMGAYGTKDLTGRTQFGRVELFYSGPNGADLTLIQTNGRTPPVRAGGAPAAISVQGTEAVQERNPDRPNEMAITWFKDGYTIAVVAKTTSEFTEEDLRGVMESIE